MSNTKRKHSNPTTTTKGTDYVTATILTDFKFHTPWLGLPMIIERKRTLCALEDPFGASETNTKRPVRVFKINKTPQNSNSS